MTTSAIQSLNALRFANMAAKSYLSTFLQPFYNVLLPEDQQIEHLDLTNNTPVGGLLNNSDLVGLELFTNLKTLILKDQANLSWAANISSLTKLETLVLHSQAVLNQRSSVNLDLGKLTSPKHLFLGTPVGLYGDMSAYTTLEYIFASLNNDGGQDITDTTLDARNSATAITKVPIIGNNKNLKFLLLQYWATGTGWTSANVGTISDLVKVTKFDISNGKSTTAVVDSILSQLHTAKTNGGALTEVWLNGSNMGIPTGANSNTDAVALRGMGVTVTVRTS
jgi:hypothetical protein